MALNLNGLNIGQRSGKVGLNTHRLFIFSTNSWFLAIGGCFYNPPILKHKTQDNENNTTRQPS